MESQWFYAEKGESVGPLSTEEVFRRIRKAPDAPHLVWAEGLPEWKEAHAVPQFSAAFRKEARAKPTPAEPDREASRPETGAHATIAQRARHELIAYLTVSAYLFIWFAALMFYKATILRGVGIEFAPFGLALVKALILGKFILVLEALKIGDRAKGGSMLIVRILKKALLFTLLLVVLTIIEEIVVGYFHGREARQALSEIGGGTIPQALASSVLMFLVLVPYFAFRQLALTKGELPELLFARRTPDE
jgi:FtsH-binding integral membrane protein